MLRKFYPSYRAGVSLLIP